VRNNGPGRQAGRAGWVSAAEGTGHRKAAEGPEAGGFPGPVSLFCARLKQLQKAAGITQTSLAAAAHLGTSQMSDILNGRVRQLPAWEVADAVVGACLEHAHKEGRALPDDLRDRKDWRRRHGDAEHDLDGQGRPRRRAGGPVGGAAAGWPLEEVTDPFDFDLEIHKPVEPGTPRLGLPLLPEYVARDHDNKLECVVRAAADGSSGMTVLVGGSSTGKTRACWEALGLLRGRPEGWRLWHPIDPSRPEAALDGLSSIGPRTVVWLNEAQFYLGVTAEGLGERVAARLRELLRDRDRAPVLVLATLWPQHWGTLTARPAAQDDPHAHARELLADRDITVPAAFTPDQVRQLRAAGDPRLAMAAEAAEEGRVIQFLAGAPELVARHRNAPPAAAALISAAMDARRLGMAVALPFAFLEQAAPGYLSDTEWDGLGDDWLEQALAYTAEPCNGVRGPLTPIRSRPGHEVRTGQVPAYRLADYLEQNGRLTRRAVIPPPAFWEAASRHAAPADLLALASAASGRGLLRDAARLRKHAAGHVSATEAAALVRDWPHPHKIDPRPAQWAADHASLNDPFGVSRLLDALREAGAEQQAAALLDRDPAAHASLDTPLGVGYLLDALRRAGAEQQAAVLASRAAAHAFLDDPPGIADLLITLLEAGAEEQTAALLDRDPAAHASLDNPSGVAHLMYALRRAGAEQQTAALASRAAAHASLDDPSGVADLLDNLRRAGAEQQTAALASRAAAHASLDDPSGVAELLRALWEVGAGQQGVALLSRDPAAHASLDNPFGVARLMGALWGAGAWARAEQLGSRAAAHASLDDPSGVARLLDALRETEAVRQQAAVLLDRDPAAHASLDDPSGIAYLLGALRRAGAEQQAAALGSRAAAHASFDDPYGVSRLLDALREAGAEQQAGTLVDRLSAEGLFRLLCEQPGHVGQYRFGRESVGSAARSWGWDDLDPPCDT